MKISGYGLLRLPRGVLHQLTKRLFIAGLEFWIVSQIPPEGAFRDPRRPRCFCPCAVRQEGGESFFFPGCHCVLPLFSASEIAGKRRFVGLEVLPHLHNAIPDAADGHGVAAHVGEVRHACP